jgi:hypothetical protein
MDMENQALGSPMDSQKKVDNQGHTVALYFKRITNEA